MSIKERRSTRLNTGKYRSNSSSGMPPSWDARASKLGTPKEQEFLRRESIAEMIRAGVGAPQLTSDNAGSAADSEDPSASVQGRGWNPRQRSPDNLPLVLSVKLQGPSLCRCAPHKWNSTQPGWVANFSKLPIPS